MKKSKLISLIKEEYRKSTIQLEQGGGSEEAAFDKEFSKAANDIAVALGNELKTKDKKDLNEAILLTAISAIMTANAVVGLISKYSAKLFKLLNFKKGEDVAEKIYHWAHDNEMAFQSPIKRVLGFFVKDAKTLDILTKAIYAIVVGTMAAGYGAQVIDKLSNADWFSSALGALKTVAKADETIVNSYPAIRSLIG
jgi:hypothetical protein